MKQYYIYETVRYEVLANSEDEAFTVLSEQGEDNATYIESRIEEGK